MLSGVLENDLDRCAKAIFMMMLVYSYWKQLTCEIEPCWCCKAWFCL